MPRPPPTIWHACILAPVAALLVHRPDPDAHQTTALPFFRQEMQNFKDLQYYGSVMVGDQTVNCVLDTGSIDFVVLSDKCKHWCGPENKLFHAHKSTSYLSGVSNLVLSYGSGQLSAQEAYDQVTLGPMHLDNACFWEIVDASMPLLLESDFQAIIGFGPIELSQPVLIKQSSRDDTKRSAFLPQALHVERFSICLGGEPGSSGWFTWNDNSISDPAIRFTKLRIPSTGYWMVELRDVTLGNVSIGCEEGCGAVVDSGTSMLAMPDHASDRLERALAGMHADCLELGSLPDLRFRLGKEGAHYSLPSDSYVGEVIGEPSQHASNYFKAKKKSKCEVTTMSISMESDLGSVWILGVPFLRKYYTVFQQGTRVSAPAVYTALADSDCRPSNPTVGSLISTKLETHRKIDAAALRMPSWAHSGSLSGDLQRHRTAGRELRNRTALGPPT